MDPNAFAVMAPAPAGFALGGQMLGLGLGAPQGLGAHGATLASQSQIAAGAGGLWTEDDVSDAWPAALAPPPPPPRPPRPPPLAQAPPRAPSPAPTSVGVVPPFR